MTLGKMTAEPLPLHPAGMQATGFDCTSSGEESPDHNGRESFH